MTKPQIWTTLSLSSSFCIQAVTPQSRYLLKIFTTSSFYYHCSSLGPLSFLVSKLASILDLLITCLSDNTEYKSYHLSTSLNYFSGLPLPSEPSPKPFPWLARACRGYLWYHSHLSSYHLLQVYSLNFFHLLENTMMSHTSGCPQILFSLPRTFYSLPFIWLNVKHPSISEVQETFPTYPAPAASCALSMPSSSNTLCIYPHCSHYHIKASPVKWKFCEYREKGYLVQQCVLSAEQTSYTY